MKYVLVRWKARGAVMGQRRSPGDEDVILASRVRFLRSGGLVDVIGPASSAVPRITVGAEEDDDL